MRGVIVTALAHASNQHSYDFVSRFFAPGSGIDEDPVTGSAHCALAPYWAPRTGKTQMTGFQASRRGGIVKVRPVEDRVFLSGQAVTVLRGELIARMKFELPESTFDPEPPPILGTWRSVYTVALVWLAFLIILFYAFTRYFA